MGKKKIHDNQYLGDERNGKEEAAKTPRGRKNSTRQKQRAKVRGGDTNSSTEGGRFCLLARGRVKPGLSMSKLNEDRGGRAQKSTIGGRSYIFFEKPT